MATPASAFVACDTLEQLVDRAKHRAVLDSPALEGATFCQTSQDASGGAAFHCGWGYEYRSAAANTAFDQVVGQVKMCLTPQEVTEAGAQVNHPDSFDQRHYTVDGVRISLSLKDKGALQQTYVFLAVHEDSNGN